MQIANGWLKLNKFGSTVPLRGITPAEAAILQKGHEVNAGGVAVLDVVVYGNVNRKDSVELDRLRHKYKDLGTKDGTKTITVFSQLFSGLSAKAPQTFDDVGIPYTLGKNKVLKDSPEVVLTDEEKLLMDEKVEEVEEVEA